MDKQHIYLRGVGAGLGDRLWEAERLLRIGRLQQLEVVLNDSSVSRRHAEVAWTEQGWVVRDLGSVNGTFLNGERVGRGDRPVRKGDVLQCGSVHLLVESLRGGAGGDEEANGGRVEVLGSLKQSREEALERMAGATREKLLALFHVGRDFRHTPSLDACLEWVLYEAAEALGAQAGCVALRDENSEQLTLRAAFAQEAAGGRQAWFSGRLSQRVLRSGESLLCRTAPDGEAPRSMVCVLLRSLHRPLGVLCLERGPAQEPFTPADLVLADALAVNVSTSIDSLWRWMERERNLLLHTLTALAQTVELRDPYTGGHTQRVTDYALLLAEELQLPARECDHLRTGTPLHDLGKIGIADTILQKAGPLTPAEAECMKSHTTKGAALLESIPGLAPLLPIVRSHHEQWDGSGYPDGLAGTDLPLLARVVAVADAFDAMTSDRPYRQGLPMEVAFAEMGRRSGTQFDPECAAAFVRLRPRIEELFEQRRHVLATVGREELARLTKEPEKHPRSHRPSAAS